ncbi:hypothetical protein BO94DRAFT_623046 [Aspergillus sclerotioniger CBS 115572]|uniref:Protein kinase domain-containing protein n=1 Tax=Aspergillus sclerotioniger CBS 115572 TaxID=1450535 RepID=A0A317WZ21_9EURO|nr:hypothetical protein BO94DRAFT_623046 [Aspergillus sclerotioniger CBS 115572]PWY91626.1 hypothetical protein BO94DRAFT_623046 [Aspergillus sclerotioniger CBS 115572]
MTVEDPSRSTRGNIPAPKGKRCPLRLLPWADCESQQQEIYRSVCHYLEPPGQDAEQLFLPRITLKGFGQALARHLSSEKDLEGYEHFGVEIHVRDIIAALCKKPDARDEFHLSDGVTFDNHANSLEPPQVSQSPEGSPSRPSRPDQFCIRRGDSDSILTTVEYKPPHKLSVENIRSGLRPMDFWEEVVAPDFVPTQEEEKLRYNAARLTGSALVQEFHVMIQQGLEYSYLTNGLALVLLRVPYDDPTTLYYHLCEPNMEVNPEDDHSFQLPVTSIARVLCLCLMSSRSTTRDQDWRNNARLLLPIWTTSFDYEHSQIPVAELRKIPPDAQYIPPASTSSSSVQESARHADTGHAPSYQNQHHQAQFCTQKCLLSLKQGGLLDEHCPNVTLHRKGESGSRHLIKAETLVQLIKRQLDDDIDDCTPMGRCGASGAPFKITCAAYGYTVVGKGITTYLWNEVSREADIYHILSQVQGLVVPVFLGAIDMDKIYFLDRAGEIEHMLLMAWAGKPISKTEATSPDISSSISKAVKKIRSLGVLHQDLRVENLLWNDELRRVMIIDFHCSVLDRQLMKKRPRKTSCGEDTRQQQRHRLV